jgi:hypothetical protein
MSATLVYVHEARGGALGHAHVALHDVLAAFSFRGSRTAVAKCDLQSDLADLGMLSFQASGAAEAKCDLQSDLADLRTLSFQASGTAVAKNYPEALDALLAKPESIIAFRGFGILG